MDKDKAEGIVEELTGKTQEAIGEALGDTEAQIAGTARELSGAGQDSFQPVFGVGDHGVRRIRSRGHVVRWRKQSLSARQSKIG
jgi:uncharacterized protein YjbJ (UPF0337 family)